MSFLRPLSLCSVLLLLFAVQVSRSPIASAAGPLQFRAANGSFTSNRVVGGDSFGTGVPGDFTCVSTAGAQYTNPLYSGANPDLDFAIPTKPLPCATGATLNFQNDLHSYYDGGMDGANGQPPRTKQFSAVTGKASETGSFEKLQVSVTGVSDFTYDQGNGSITILVTTSGSADSYQENIQSPVPAGGRLQLTYNVTVSGLVNGTRNGFCAFGPPGTTDASAVVVIGSDSDPSQPGQFVFQQSTTSLVNGTNQLKTTPIIVGPSGTYALYVSLSADNFCTPGQTTTVTFEPSCNVSAVAAASSGNFSINGWTGTYAVSGQSGLELDNIALNGRLMAQAMNLPYFKLQTSEFNSAGHCQLLQNGTATPNQCRSRLVDLQNGNDGQAVQATYVVDQIPQTSNSCLRVTQRYEFAPAGGDCPEDNLFRCASFYPLVTYQFIPDPQQTQPPALSRIDVAQRFQFDVEQSPVNTANIVPGENTAAVTKDFPSLNPPGAVTALETDPLAHEQLIKAIIGGNPGDWDNYHQTNDLYGVSEPGLDTSLFHFSFGAGCTECVHIHWHWGLAAKAGLGFVNPSQSCQLGNPAFPLVPGQLGCLPERPASQYPSNQDVTVAVVSGTQPAKPTSDFTTFVPAAGGAALDHQPVLWYGGTGYQSEDTFFAHGGFFSPTGLPLPGPVAALLPTVRSASVNAPVTAFATIINAGSTPGTGCSIAPADTIPATFDYQTTNPTTNALTGTVNTPVDIAAGASQSFVVAFTPTAAFNPTEIALNFNCGGAGPAPSESGLNGLLLSASGSLTPDIVALGATTTNDQILHIPGSNGAGAFAVATINLGSAAQITAAADAGGSLIPLTLNLCQTNPVSGQCVSAIGSTVTTQINPNDTPTFAVFAAAGGPISLDPTGSRIFVSFFDQSGTVRGGTSVAVQTQ